MSGKHQPTHWQPPETKLIEGRPVSFRDVVVHTITMGDVEDPDIYVAAPMATWQNSEVGQWIMQNAVTTPYWYHHVDYNSMSNQYHIVARLSEQNETFWKLKWGGLKK